MSILSSALNQVPSGARTAMRLPRNAARAAVTTSSRRLANHPRQRNWSLPFEFTVEVMARGVPVSEANALELMRSSMESLKHISHLRGIRAESVAAAGVPALWLRNHEQGAPFLLYLHGGGYVSGSPQTHLALMAELSAVSGAQVLAPDYRLAPEAPYPAALEDAWCAYWWLLLQGVPPAQIVVAGDSAGGGLSLALLLALRDAGAPLPAGGLLLSPWLDLAHTGSSLHTNAHLDYLNLAILRSVAQMYLGGQDPRTPLASPLYADLRGLPSLLIQVGTCELLLDDSRRLAQRASAAGVAVELELWENMIHVWHFMFAIEARARQALQRAGRFVRAATRETA